MELLKVDDGCVKIILTKDECRELGVFEEDEKKLKERICSLISESEDALPEGNLIVRVSARISGGVEILVEAESDRAEIHTFLLDENELERITLLLETSGLIKNSALYKTYASGSLILETLAPRSSPVLSRLDDFSQRLVLSQRRDYLSSCACRIPFLKTEENENEQTGASSRNT